MDNIKLTGFNSCFTTVNGLYLRNKKSENTAKNSAFFHTSDTESHNVESKLPQGL